jgi:hypothetical protein
MPSDSPTAESENTVAATAFRPELPYVNRPHPRAFGTGRYGVAKHDERDNTRYAWNRVLPAVTVFLAMLVGMAAPAHAQNAYCEGTDSVTTQFLFCKPSVDVEGVNRWGDKWNTNIDMIETAMGTISAATGTATTALAALATSTTALSVSTSAIAAGGATTYLRITGGTMTGQVVLSAGPAGALGNLTGNVVGNVVGNADTATSATTATNLAAGGTGQLPYQSGAGATAMLAAGADTQALVGGASGPAWSTLAGSTLATNISGLAARATAFGTAPTVCSAQAATGIDVNGNAVGCFSAGTGDVVKASSQTLSGSNTIGGAYATTTTFNGAVRISSWSMVNVTGSATQASMLVCTSTITLTPTTSTVTIKADGAVSVTGASRTGVGVMQNGAFILGQSASLPLTDFGQSQAGYNHPLSFERIITGLTPGVTYSWCIAFMMDSGVTMTIPGSLSSNYQFLVREETLR